MFGKLSDKKNRVIKDNTFIINICDKLVYQFNMIIYTNHIYQIQVMDAFSTNDFNFLFLG